MDGFWTWFPWVELLTFGSAKTGVDRTLSDKNRLAKIEPTRSMNWSIFFDTLIMDKICFYYSTHKRNCQ